MNGLATIWWGSHFGSDTDLTMSTTQSSQSASKRERLEQYLHEQLDGGELYFKSKFIAEEVGLTPKEIGALMVQLKDSPTDLSIEQWSYTGATTWRVTPA